MTIFLKSGGQLWALEDYWTQVEVATGHSASITDFNWSPARISVSNFDFLWDFIVIVMFSRLVNLWALKLFFAHNFLLIGHKADVVPLFWPYEFLSGSSSSLLCSFAETSGFNIGARESVLLGVSEYYYTAEPEYCFLGGYRVGYIDHCSLRSWCPCYEKHCFFEFTVVRCRVYRTGYYLL